MERKSKLNTPDLPNLAIRETKPWTLIEIKAEMIAAGVVLACILYKNTETHAYAVDIRQWEASGDKYLPTRRGIRIYLKEQGKVIYDALESWGKYLGAVETKKENNEEN